MSPVIFFLMQFAILAYALVAGVFLAFSDFNMRSLALTGGVGGVEAMQVINREVFRWVFMALFLGMAAVSLILAGYGAFGLSGPAGALMLAAGLVYLIGCFGVTILCNVPMNEALAGMTTKAQDTRVYWQQTYVPRWTFWNTVRAMACTLSAALLLVGLLWMAHIQSQGVSSTAPARPTGDETGPAPVTRGARAFPTRCGPVALLGKIEADRAVIALFFQIG